MDASRLAAALSGWSEALGAAHVVRDPAELDRASTATFPTAGRIRAVLRPGSRDEVRAALTIATRERVPLHPVSGGKNWGLGSRVPPRDAVLLDLGRLNRIVEVDEELAFARIEPGVTFQDLYDRLRATGSRLFVSTTGGSPLGSVLANALERGDGSGPNGDRVAHLAALEVVLPTGEVVNTGFERFSGTALGPLHRHGVGPSLDGLFTQSNLGVVTQGTVWLAPLPRHLGIVRFAVPERSQLGRVADAVRTLLLEGTLRTGVGIWNDWRVLSVAERYPYAETGDRTPLPRALLERRAAAWGGAAWLGLASIYAATAELGLAARRRVEQVLGPWVAGLEVDARDGEPTSGHELYPAVEPGHCFLQGIPHERSLESVYWRKREPAPEHPDPDRDGCGVIWLCPTLPLRGADVEAATNLVEARMLEHGFEPLVALMAQAPRTALLLPMIVYDRAADGDDERAMACHDVLLRELSDRGYLPHRLGTASFGSLPAPRDDSARVLKQLKQLLDPSDVLSPGRYDFRDAWPEGPKSR